MIYYHFNIPTVDPFRCANTHIYNFSAFYLLETFECLWTFEMGMMTIMVSCFGICGIEKNLLVLKRFCRYKNMSFVLQVNNIIYILYLSTQQAHNREALSEIFVWILVDIRYVCKCILSVFSITARDVNR